MASSAHPGSTAPAGRPFDVSGGDAMAAAVRSFLDGLAAPPTLLGLGEPTHGEPAFPLLRNRILEVLVERGFRSIAIESDRAAGLAVDAFVRGRAGTLESALSEGFSHGFGGSAANRELVAWLRAYNAGRPPAGQVAFHGFDVPLEMTGAPGPRRWLEHLHGYLAGHLGADAVPHGRADLAELVGDDDRWSDPAALLDAGRCVGASPAAASLRVVADDLMTTLYARAPHLIAGSSPADWRRAEVSGATALALLRYHAQAAEDADPAVRTSRLLGVRDASMARHLLDIQALEQHRGPTLVFAHNRHLQRHPSTWQLAGMDLTWSGAGAIVASLLGERYAVVTGSLGASAARGLPAPAPGTFEGVLAVPGGGCALRDRAQLSALDGAVRRADLTAEHGVFPLDAETLAHSDAVLHVTVGGDEHAAAPTAADVADRIFALPGVTCVQADEASGAPEVSWGDRFFFVGAGRRHPFATIVGRDTPGFDTDSDLDRPGVFRLNLRVGREQFRRLFGYPPAEFDAHRSDVDFTRLDEILPHPAYAGLGWVCVVRPGARRLECVVGLLAHVLTRAAGAGPQS